MSWGRRSTIWDPMGPHQIPHTAIHTPKATQFALSTLNVGQDPSSCLKIANDTPLFSQPTSSMPLGHRSTIWDPGGPHPTPQTSIHTPKTTQFALSTLNVGQDPSSCLKIVNDTHPFSHPTSTMPWGRSLTIWDPRGPHQSPQTAKHTLKATQLPLSTLNVGKDLSSCP